MKTSNPALLGKPLLQANVILATGASQFEVSKKGKRKSKRKSLAHSAAATSLQSTI